MRAWGGVLALASALWLSACSIEEPLPVGELAPDFDLERLEGGQIQLADLRGKYVLLDFWATWCSPCVLEIPELNAFYQESRASGVEVLAISVDLDERQSLLDWATKKGILYPVALGTTEVARSYGAAQYPYHVLVGPDGRVLERLTPGYHDRDELRAVLARHHTP